MSTSQKKQNALKLFALILAFISLVIIMNTPSSGLTSSALENANSLPIETNAFENANLSPIGENDLKSANALSDTQGFSTGARSAIVMYHGSDRVFFEKNADAQLPIASTTKILTAITVIENTPDLNKVITVPDEAVGVEGSSIYLQRGEKVKIIDLLYGLMLQSGNDCAVALAIVTSKSVENFADLMNKTAKKAGAADCNFVNPHGLHHEKHRCSARELGKITSYALNNEIFRKIVSTKVYKDCPYAGRDYNRLIKNKNKILSSLEGCDGVKTGYTVKAGRCLVASATREHTTVIAVVLNCGPMFEDCSRMINAAFDIISAERAELDKIQI